jgi:hypothetical protein
LAMGNLLRVLEDIRLSGFIYQCSGPHKKVI